MRFCKFLLYLAILAMSNFGHTDDVPIKTGIFTITEANDSRFNNQIKEEEEVAQHNSVRSSHTPLHVVAQP